MHEKKDWAKGGILKIVKGVSVYRKVRGVNLHFITIQPYINGFVIAIGQIIKRFRDKSLEDLETNDLSLNVIHDRFCYCCISY